MALKDTQKKVVVDPRDVFRKRKEFKHKFKFYVIVCQVISFEKCFELTLFMIVDN